jgi:hypothetical protein
VPECLAKKTEFSARLFAPTSIYPRTHALCPLPRDRRRYMELPQIYDKLTAVFQGLFDDDSLQVTTELTARDVIDSVNKCLTLLKLPRRIACWLMRPNHHSIWLSQEE